MGLPSTIPAAPVTAPETPPTLPAQCLRRTRLPAPHGLPLGVWALPAVPFSALANGLLSLQAVLSHGPLEGVEGHFAIWPGGSARAQLDRVTFEQVRVEAIDLGLVTDDELKQALALLEDPAIAFSSPVMFSAWGWRPAH